VRSHASPWLAGSQLRSAARHHPRTRGCARRGL